MVWKNSYALVGRLDVQKLVISLCTPLAPSVSNRRHGSLATLASLCAFDFECATTRTVQSAAKTIQHLKC